MSVLEDFVGNEQQTRSLYNHNGSKQKYSYLVIMSELRMNIVQPTKSPKACLLPACAFLALACTLCWEDKT